MKYLDFQELACQLRSTSLALEQFHQLGFDEVRTVDEQASVSADAALDRAKRIYSNRRKRRELFDDSEIFGEPTWDMLLDLFIRQSSDKTTSVTSACIAADTPTTTGLRWLKVLADRGHITIISDPKDRRRRLVRLSDRSYLAMCEYLNDSA
jgi:hypothetical protein